MATAAKHPNEETMDRLAAAIRRIQPACVPHEVARTVLTYDVPGHTHVFGLTCSGNVLFYHCNDRYVVSVPIDADGLADGGPVRATWNQDACPNVGRWVWKRRDWWEWLHPRYDWR